VNLMIQADPPPLYEANDRVVRISGTRVPLERVIRAFLAGSTPEQIALDYDVLPLEDVYAIVNYYLHHRSEVDAYLGDVEADAARTRDEIERQHDLNGIRERLFARRSTKAE
jgi:uncharacterized protein (DUF433 family)